MLTMGEIRRPVAEVRRETSLLHAAASLAECADVRHQVRDLLAGEPSAGAATYAPCIPPVATRVSPADIPKLKIFLTRSLRCHAARRAPSGSGLAATLAPAG